MYLWSNAVWELSGAKGAPLLVMLTFAEHSDENGLSWPRTTTVAHCARITKRGTQKAIRILAQDGRLREVEKPTPYKAGRYQIIEPVVVASVAESILRRSERGSPRSERGSPRSERSSPRSERSSPRSEPGSPRSEPGSQRIIIDNPLIEIPNELPIEGEGSAANGHAHANPQSRTPLGLAEKATPDEAWEQLIEWLDGEHDRTETDTIENPVTRAFHAQEKTVRPELPARTARALRRAGGVKRLIHAHDQKPQDIPFLLRDFKAAFVAAKTDG